MDTVTSPLVEAARSHALGDLPRRTAARWPDKVAVVDGGTTLTFRELEDRVDRVAAAIAQVTPRTLLLPTLAKQHPGLR